MPSKYTWSGSNLFNTLDIISKNSFFSCSCNCNSVASSVSWLLTRFWFVFNSPFASLKLFIFISSLFLNENPLSVTSNFLAPFLPVTSIFWAPFLPVALFFSALLLFAAFGPSFLAVERASFNFSRSFLHKQGFSSGFLSPFNHGLSSWNNSTRPSNAFAWSK